MVCPHRDEQPSFQVLLTQQTGGVGNGEEEESEGEGRQREEGVRVRGLEGVCCVHGLSMLVRESA